MTAFLMTACSGMSAKTAIPPAKSIEAEDIRRLGGQWKGTWTEGTWTGPITLTIDPDDVSGEFAFETPNGPARSAGYLAIIEGNLVLVGDAGRTTLTLHEDGQRAALIGGYRYGTGQTGTMELWRQ